MQLAKAIESSIEIALQVGILSQSLKVLRLQTHFDHFKWVGKGDTDCAGDEACDDLL